MPAPEIASEIPPVPSGSPAAAAARLKANEPLGSKFWDPRTARVLFTILIFLAVVLFLRAASETLTLFLFAILFAYLLTPLVNRLEALLHSRSRAVASVYLFLALVITGIVLGLGPKMATEGKALMTSLPSLTDRLISGQLVTEFGIKHQWSAGTIHQVQSLLASHRDQILSFVSSFGERLAKDAQHIWWIIIIPILSLFFLLEGESMAKSAIELGRSRLERNVLGGLVFDINVMLGSYIRAQILLCILTGVAYTVVLGLMGVPYMLFMGPIAGLLEFIPVVGPAVGAAAVFLIAILSYPHPLWVFLFLGTWRLIQDYYSAPRIMGKSLEIDPLTEIFAVLAGGEIAGVVGALISVPVLAILRIIFKRIQSAREAAELEVQAAIERHRLAEVQAEQDMRDKQEEPATAAP